MKANLAAALLQLEINKKENINEVESVNSEGDKQMSGDELEDVNNEGDPEMRRTQIEISSTEYGDESSKSARMSGLSLSLSSSSDDGPIMMGICNSRRARIKRLRETNQENKAIQTLLDERVLVLLPTRLTK